MKFQSHSKKDGVKSLIDTFNRWFFFSLIAMIFVFYLCAEGKCYSPLFLSEVIFEHWLVSSL